MLKTFLTHQVMRFKRSRNAGTTVAVYVVIALLVFYLLASAIIVGLYLDEIIQEVYPGMNSVYYFNGLIIYYFMLDFLLRLQFQELPTISIQPYLHLNIKRKKIVKFLNIKGILSAFNILPFVVFLPFIFTKITTLYNGNTATFYAVGLLGQVQTIGS